MCMGSVKGGWGEGGARSEAAVAAQSVNHNQDSSRRAGWPSSWGLFQSSREVSISTAVNLDPAFL